MRGGDKDLEEYLLSTGGGNAMYISPKIQNALLDAALLLTRECVVRRAKNSLCWSLIADETTDRAKRELMVIVLRYVTEEEESVAIHEDPVLIFDALKSISSESGESPVESEVRLTGVNVARLLHSKCEELGLNTKTCIGQGFDGAASLSSTKIGAAAEFKKIAAPLAKYYHCMMHAFNLCASQGVSTTFARNCMDKVHELATFFSSSAKRHQLLEQCVQNSDIPLVSSFKHLCTTRFVERHDAILTALDLLPVAHEALEKMSDWDSRESRVAASSLLSSISSFEFIITLQALSKLSALLINVSRSLQQPGIDIMKALDDVHLVEKAIS
jgi:hypothetical protein